MLYRLALASSLLLVAGCGSPSSPAAQGGHDVHPGDPPMLRVVDSAIPDDVFRFGMGTSVVGEVVNEGGGSPVVLLEAEVLDARGKRIGRAYERIGHVPAGQHVPFDVVVPFDNEASIASKGRARCWVLADEPVSR